MCVRVCACVDIYKIRVVGNIDYGEWRSHREKSQAASYQFYRRCRRRRVAIRFLLSSNAFKLFIMGLLFQSTSANDRVHGKRMAGENIIRRELTLSTGRSSFTHSIATHNQSRNQSRIEDRSLSLLLD